MISSLRSLFLVVSSGITFFSLAQLPVVDLTIAPGTNNDLEVRLRPTLDFDGVLSGLVVTVRWDAASSAHLGGISQTVPANQYVALGKSGGEIDDSGNRYQVFAGFGFTALSDIPTQWTAGTEYTIGNLAAVSQRRKETDRQLAMDEEQILTLRSALAEAGPRVDAARAEDERSNVALEAVEARLNEWQASWESFNERAAANQRESDVEASRIDTTFLLF